MSETEQRAEELKTKLDHLVLKFQKCLELPDITIDAKIMISHEWRKTLKYLELISHLVNGTEFKVDTDVQALNSLVK